MFGSFRSDRFVPKTELLELTSRVYETPTVKFSNLFINLLKFVKNHNGALFAMVFGGFVCDIVVSGNGEVLF